LTSGPECSKYANSTKKAWFFPDTQEKICAKCDTKTHVSNFFKHHQTKDGYHSWCKKCCKKGNNLSRAKKYSSFEGRIATFLSTCRKSAEKRKQICSITADDLKQAWEAQSGICVYTGWAMTTQANCPTTVSVERIDSKQGYTKENTALVCNAVNRMKSNFSGEFFYSVCQAVVTHLGDNNGELAVDFVKQ
jgi:hypothetical protein